MSSTSLQNQTRQIGQLDCTVVDTPRDGDRFRAFVVLCHGFGAPGDDLVPCASELFAAGDGLTGIRFVFPAAPLELETGGLFDSRAWWPIDMMKLQQMIERGELRDLRNQRPELLDHRFDQIIEVIDQLKQETGLTNKQLILGGFSQGAMLTTEVALRISESAGGLIVWSGNLLSENLWREYASKRGTLRVIQTHGRIDPILPFAGAELLHRLFVENKFDAQFFPFIGPHTISREGIDEAAKLIGSVATSVKN